MTDSLATIPQKIASSARKGANPETRVIDGEDVDLPYGYNARQGDAYIQRLPIDEVDVSGFAPTTERQIAPGKTVGSRHVVTTADDSSRPADIYDRGGNELTGPVIVAPQGFYLSHPQHADIDFRLPGAYLCTFPADEKARELGEIRRRMD